MEQNNRASLLRMSFPCESITLLEKAKFIYNKHSLVSVVLDIDEWEFSNRKISDFQHQEIVPNLILKSFKKEIRQHTIIRDIPDDYIDNFNSALFFTTGRNCTSFSYYIFAKGKSKYNSSLIVRGYDKLSVMNSFSAAKKFLYDLIEIFDPFSIEVTDSNLYSFDEMSNKFWPGWMLYFSSIYQLPELPAWVKAETLPNGGHLIITTEEVFDPANPEHKEKARSLLGLLQLR